MGFRREPSRADDAKAIYRRKVANKNLTTTLREAGNRFREQRDSSRRPTYYTGLPSMKLKASKCPMLSEGRSALPAHRVECQAARNRKQKGLRRADGLSGGRSRTAKRDGVSCAVVMFLRECGESRCAPARRRRWSHAFARYPDASPRLRRRPLVYAATAAARADAARVAAADVSFRLRD